MSGSRVVVAMSGGVDSSAAAVLLTQQGYDVIGVSMQVWDYRLSGGSASRASCCAPSDFDDAREVAAAFKFPYYVFDFEDSFEREVITPFVHSYLRGETPNPCIECNRRVKFKELRERARTLGATAIATGHYAQIKAKADGVLGLYTARDRAKDQSYFLYALGQEELRSTMFPIGALSKSEVRSILRRHGLRVAAKAESQDICFVSSSAAQFVEAHAAAAPPPGSIVTSDGTSLGTHLGIHHFTVGQRKGLGGGSRSPLYVLKIDAQENRVIVGTRDELRREAFFVRDLNWIGRTPRSGMFRTKLRYRDEGRLCAVEALAHDCARVRFLDEWSAVSPGQAAVFYGSEPDDDGDYEVVGGGTISSEC